MHYVIRINLSMKTHLDKVCGNTQIANTHARHMNVLIKTHLNITVNKIYVNKNYSKKLIKNSYRVTGPATLSMNVARVTSLLLSPPQSCVDSVTSTIL